MPTSCFARLSRCSVLPRAWRIVPCVLLALAACSGSDEEDCSIAGQNAFLYALMKDAYLWADETPDLDPAEFESPQALLEAMAFREFDRWSSISSAARREALFRDGRSIGLGVRLSRDSNGDLRFIMVEAGSPAEEAGLERGMKIIAINGKTIQEIDDENLWSTIHGPDEPGVTVVYAVEALDGSEREVSIEKDWIELMTVLKTAVVERDEHTVGYLLFTGFLSPSDDDLRQSFAEFAERGVTDLVLDLRYNSGGLLSTARTLASLIVGPARAGEVFSRMEYNPRHASWNSELVFEDEPDAVPISKLVGLTGGGTASASELLLNGLEPYVSTEQVGTKTHGKPVGSNTWTRCELAFSPITFRTVNAEGGGDYFGGLVPDCEAPDDLGHALGDPEEARFQSAIHLIETGECPPLEIELRSLDPGVTSPARPPTAVGAPLRRSNDDELGVF